MCDGDGLGHASAGVECCFDLHRAWPERFDQVVQNGVGNVFVKNPFVTKALQIEFQTFEFHTLFGRLIADCQRAEVGLARAGANRGELGSDNLDGIRSLGILVVKSLEQSAEVSHRCIGSFQEAPHCGMIERCVEEAVGIRILDCGIRRHGGSIETSGRNSKEMATKNAKSYQKN